MAYQSANKGETAAIAGYNFQYSIFASEIYDALLDPKADLEWVEFASNEAGKLDDVLICLKDRILAYQIKNISQPYFTYRDFVGGESGSIFCGMFAGWRELRRQYPQRKIIARLLTTQRASLNDDIVCFEGNGKATFHRFVQDFWRPLRASTRHEELLSAGWGRVFAEMRTLCEGTEQELKKFIADADFIFDYTPYQHPDTYIQRQRELDIEKISQTIFTTIGKNGRQKFTKPQILQLFSLQNRYESFFQHSFFVDDAHYQPLDKTINELEQILRNKTRGYIALIGNAGSGKSTLVTKWINACDYHVLKFYAYVNTEMNNEFGYRGEAKIFLHDLLVQMRKGGQGLNRLPTDNVTDLQKQFHEELNNLSRKSKPIIILVDGLDHIEREQSVRQSLLDILPSPESIPENIYFVLGSRTVDHLEQLSARIKHHLNEEQRIIFMATFDIFATKNLVTSHGLSIASEQLQLLQQNTGGHPLFLAYTIEELKGTAVKEWNEIISGKKFSGDIYTEYRIFWEKYKERDGLIKSLGLIARFRHAHFDIEIASQLSDLSRADQLAINKLAEFYFFKNGNIWQFYHNSFKEFLREETAKNVLTGKFDFRNDHAFHSTIAQRVDTLSSDYKWNKIFHLHAAAKYEEIIAILSQQYFRDQWFAFRKYQLIKEDILLGVDSCEKAKEIYKLLTCFFSLFELRQRYNNFDPATYYNAFHQLGHMEIANSFIYDNTGLLVSENTALQYCEAIYRKGYVILAKEIFEKATPRVLLDRSKSLSTKRVNEQSYEQINEIELIALWARVASLFILPEDILQRLASYEVEPDDDEATAADFLEQVTNEILEISVDLAKWENLASLENVFIEKKDTDGLFFVYFETAVNLPRGHSFYDRSIQQLENWEPSSSNAINRRLFFFYVKQSLPEKASAAFTRLATPKDVKEKNAFDIADWYVRYVFEYAAGYYITNKAFSTDPSAFLPEERKYTVNGFFRAVAELGKCYALIHHAYSGAAKAFFSHLRQTFSLFHFHMNDNGYEYAVEQKRPLLIELLLDIARAISPAFYEEILQTISGEWQMFKQYWSIEQNQSVIEIVIKDGGHTDWCKRELNILEEQLFDHGYLESRIARGVSQIRLWSAFGEISRGQRILGHLMEISLDIPGEKDYQIDYITNWIDITGNKVPEDIDFHIQRSEDLLEKVNSRTHTNAWRLFELALPFHSGFALFKYLLFEGLLDFTDAIEIALAHLVKSLPPYRRLIMQLFIRIVLAYENSHSPRHLFLQQIFAEGLDVDELKALTAGIEVYAVTEHRNQYLSRVLEYLEKKQISQQAVGITHNVTVEKETGYSHRSPDDYVDGTSLTSRQIVDEIKTIADIPLYKSKFATYTRFKWNDVWQKVLPAASDQEISLLIENILTTSDELRELGTYLRQSGKTGLSKSAFSRAASAGESYGWVTYIDGGSKIQPLKLLKEIAGPEELHPLALKEFCNSMGDFDFHTSREVFHDLHNIWSLFSKAPDLSKMHEEVRQFRNAIFKTHTVRSGVPPVSGTQSDESFLEDCLLFLLTFPSDFDLALLDILQQTYPDNPGLIHRLLDRLYSGQFFTVYFQLLTAIAVQHNSVVLHERDRLFEQLASERYDHTNTAAKLLYEHDLLNSVEVADTHVAEPLAYHLQFDYKPSLLSLIKDKMIHIDEAGFLKDTDDVLVLIKPFDWEVEYLSKRSGIPAVNLAYRIMELGRNNGLPDWCSTISEEELRSIYSGRFDLEISYRRPRVQLVRDGMMKVVKELVSLGRITQDQARAVNNDFDPGVVSISAVKKPEFVGSILEGNSQSAPSASRDWEKEITTAYVRETLLLKTSDQQYILAEHSVLYGMGWGLNQEFRQAFVDFDSETESRTHRQLIFPFTNVARTHFYLYNDTDDIIIYNGVLTTHNRRNWLAINPALCLDMGLLYNEDEGLFRWDNAQGEKIVESIFWRSNSTDNRAKHHHSESGYGWAVLLSQQGMQLMMDALGNIPLYHHRKIYRHQWYSQKKYNTLLDGDYSLSDVEQIDPAV